MSFVSYLYVDGEEDGVGDIVLKDSPTPPPASGDTLIATETILAADIQTDTDGSITGLINGLYVGTKRFPISAISGGRVILGRKVLSLDLTWVGATPYPTDHTVSYTYSAETIVLAIVQFGPIPPGEIVSFTGAGALDVDTNILSLGGNSFGWLVDFHIVQPIGLLQPELTLFIRALVQALKPAHSVAYVRNFDETYFTEV